MVPIFTFISPTFIYSFLEEKVQSSYNYLICVDFPLYAREINTKEISSVILVCKCHLKPSRTISSVPLILLGFMASRTYHTPWGKKYHRSHTAWGNWGTGRLNDAAKATQELAALCCQDKRPGQPGSQGLFSPAGWTFLSWTAISAGVQRTQRTDFLPTLLSMR